MTKIKITITIGPKFEKLLDKKAVKCRNISTNLSKSPLLSALKVKKKWPVIRSDLREKFDFGVGEGAFFRVGVGVGGTFFRISVKSLII